MKTNWKKGEISKKGLQTNQKSDKLVKKSEMLIKKSLKPDKLV